VNYGKKADTAGIVVAAQPLRSNGAGRARETTESPLQKKLPQEIHCFKMPC